MEVNNNTAARELVKLINAGWFVCAFTAEDLADVVAAIQLASKHPGVVGNPAMANAKKMARAMVDMIAVRDPLFARHLERGWHT